MDDRIIKRGDIFYIDIPRDDRDPHKQCGRRPCIIMSNDMNNKHNSRVQYIPCTTSMTKAKLPTHVRLKNTKMEKDTIALCECMDGISKAFIKEKVGRISKEDMFNIEMGMAIQVYPQGFKYIVDNMKQYSYAV